MELGKIVPFYHPRFTPIISHMLYADVVLFSNGSKASLRTIVKVLKVYEEWSGQVVNKKKSSIFFSKHIPVGRRRILLRTTGFTDGCFPFSLLGRPDCFWKIVKCAF